MLSFLLEKIRHIRRIKNASCHFVSKNSMVRHLKTEFVHLVKETK